MAVAGPLSILALHDRVPLELGTRTWISGAMYVGVPATVIAISEFLHSLITM